jgi:hypothetical protein
MDSPERFLSRKEAAEFIVNRGLPITKNTLDKMATLGGGPVHRKFGLRAVYRPEDLVAWIDGKLSKPRKSTSDAA